MHFVIMPHSFNFPPLDGAHPHLANADLIGRPNVVFTPHIAFNSFEAVKRINQTTLENINAFMASQPVNVVGKMTAAKAASDNATSALPTRAPLT